MDKQHRHLRVEDRAVIMIERCSGASVRSMARTLGRNASSISRELTRNQVASATSNASCGCDATASSQADRCRRLRGGRRRRRRKARRCSSTLTTDWCATVGRRPPPKDRQKKYLKSPPLTRGSTSWGPCANYLEIVSPAIARIARLTNDPKLHVAPSPAALCAQIDAWGITYRRADHPPVFTCDEAARLVPAAVDGAQTTNRFLRDGKGRRHWLLVTLCEKGGDLKQLSSRIGADHLSLASPARLLKHLTLTPGAVTVLGS